MMRILFIGNSYTYYNDMPKLLERLSNENGHPAEVYAVTKGGRKLHQHLDILDDHSRPLRELLDSSHHFDRVFLQEQSFLPLADFDLFADGVRRLYEYLRPFADRFVLYQTWGRKDGHPLLAERGWTHESMTDGLADAYGKMAEELGAEVSPVGREFTRVYRSHPEVELYAEDLFHPSYNGSCLVALTHYRTLFGEKPKDLGSMNLPQEVLNILL